MSEYGAQSMVSPLKRVIMRSPPPLMSGADPDVWHYGQALTQQALESQHRELRDKLQSYGAEIIDIDAMPDQLFDSVFTYDPSIVCHSGAILMRMGKELRRPEVDVFAQFYEKLGVPILGRINAPGHVESGDCLWLDDKTLIVGRGFRTNQAGIDQLCRILQALDISVHVFDLPTYMGASACLHLMSLISMLDHDLALIYQPFLPVAMYQMLVERGIRLLAAPADEFEASATLSLNVLTFKPRHCIALAGYPKTKRAMEAADCNVDTVNGDVLCVKCEGGPTCLTRPLLRG